MMRFKLYPTLKILLVMVCLSSCKLTLPEKWSIKLPVSFTGSTDTTSMGFLPWKQFFTDPKLVSLIDTALINNPDLLIAIERIEIARASLTTARGSLLPSIVPEISAGVKKVGDYTMDGVGNFDTNLSNNIKEDQHIPNPIPDYFIGARSAWEIDLWGKLRYQKEAARARFLASQKGRQLIVTSLIASVAENYYLLLVLDRELEIINKNIKLQETAVSTMNALKEGGRTNELAVKQFTSQLLNTNSLKYQKQQEIIEAETRLNLLLGRFPQPIQRGKSIIELNLPEEVKAGIPSEMLRRRPDVQQAELDLIAAISDSRSARMAFLPSFTISAYGGYNSFNKALLTSPASLAYGLFAGLTGPLINRNQIRSTYRGAIAAKKQAFQNYRKTILTGFGEIYSSLKRIENYRTVSDLKTEEVNVLLDAVASSKDLFVAGYASYLEVVTAQKNALEAELGLIDARKQQFFSLVTLYRALGGGWE